MLPQAVQARIDLLGLAPHPEGGWYRETHRSPLVIPSDALPAHPGPRCAVTSILFLLPAGERSAWHRVGSEELWFHHEGDAIDLRVRERPDDDAKTVRLGPGGVPQGAVPAGWWQDACAQPGPTGYALAGCVVAPGFEFEDLVLEPEPGTKG